MPQALIQHHMYSEMAALRTEHLRDYGTPIAHPAFPLPAAGVPAGGAGVMPGTAAGAHSGMDADASAQ
jgi:hypothetical protein